MSDRQRLEDVGYMTCMTLTLLGNYAQTGHFGGPLAYTPFNVAAHLAGPAQGGLRYDYRRPKHPYSDKFMLAAGHCAPTCYALWMILGQALLSQAPGDGRPPLLRGAGRRDAAGRRAGISPRRRRAEDAALGSGADRSPAVRPGQGARDSRAVGPHRVHRRHQRRQRRPLGRGHRDGGGQGRLLGHHGRPDGDAEDHRLRGRVRDDRGPRAGDQDPGHRPAGRQAAADLPVRQQRRHRRLADRRGRGQQVHGLSAGRSVDLVRLERLHAAGRSRLRADRRGDEEDGGVGPDGSAPDDRDRQDHQGLLAGRGQRQDPRSRRSGGRVPEPSVRDEDELRVLRLARPDVREEVRRGVRGHPQGGRDRSGRAPDPVQDQHRRGDVGARAERPGRLAGRAPGADRRFGQGRAADAGRREARPVPRRAPARSPTSPRSRRPSPCGTRSPARRSS